MQSPFIQNSLVTILAWVIPIGLLIVGMSLLFTHLRKNALLLSGFTFFLFALYTGGIIFFANYRPCSCGGISEAISWELHLGINIFLSIACFLAYRFYPSSE